MRDFKDCSDCGNKIINWHIHHIDRNHENNDPKNLMILCPECHGKEHGSEGEREETFRFGDSYDMITNKRRFGQRILFGFNLMNVED